ncbi:MAG: F0F1 ATP synthase subunit alpha, partial [Epulopiscium sp.]|nr:F0F1 ATP synthase subunit alpha [Candidatus Epulonipiscium sp.]
EIKRFEKEFIEFIDTKYSDIVTSIRERKEIDEALEKQIDGAINEFKSKFKNDK